MAGYVPLPAYQANALLNFAPVNNALSDITAQNNANRMYGLQQQAADRAQQSLDLEKQRTASDLKTQAAQYEDLTHRILASTSQGALSLTDPAARATVANGIIAGHPEMTANLTKYGVDPKNPDGVLNFFANYGQSPLDIAAKKAGIAQTETATAVARAPKIQPIGQDVFGMKYGKVNPLTGETTPLNTGDSIGNDMIKNLADGIQSGKQPPVIGQGQGTGAKINAAVKSELQRRGVDLTNLNLQWEAAHKQVNSMNGPQQVRYQQLANSVVNTINEVNGLSDQMKNSGIPAMNAAKLAVLRDTQGNTPAGQLAGRYLTATGTLKEEYANLANGGYAPTEPAWALAMQQVNENYGNDQLKASLGEIQRLVNYRLGALSQLGTFGPGAANQYLGTKRTVPTVDAHGAPQPPLAAAQPAAAPTVAPGVTHVWNPATGKIEAVGGQ